ncbi:MAG: carboxypeptidase regulatory-like domain-containing protein, partial [Clostridia bacterium]
MARRQLWQAGIFILVLLTVLGLALPALAEEGGRVAAGEEAVASAGEGNEAAGAAVYEVEGAGNDTGLAAYQAQAVTTGTITGLVKDAATGEPVSGATVTVGSYVYTTGDDGRYIFADIPAGTYNLTASRDGYRSRSTGDFPLQQGQTLNLNIALALSSIARGNIQGYVIDA